MDEAVTLSHHKLETFYTCQRRFQLRYLKRVPWPVSPRGEPLEAALLRGQRFHQVLERHFLGFDVAQEAIDDGTVRSWWLEFKTSGLALPEGRRLPEIGLTIPVGDYLLTGRFDLLILSSRGNQAFAHVFDWKTSRPRSVAELKEDWQTRLYLALLAEGGKAFTGDEQTFSPAQVAITYWYVGEPNAPRTIPYTASWHARNWAEIEGLLEEMARRRDEDIWPLADDWSFCRPCAYQAHCNRHQTGHFELATPEEETPDIDLDLQLEPQLP